MCSPAGSAWRRGSSTNHPPTRGESSARTAEDVTKTANVWKPNSTRRFLPRSLVKLLILQHEAHLCSWNLAALVGVVALMDSMCASLKSADSYIRCSDDKAPASKRTSATLPVGPPRVSSIAPQLHKASVTKLRRLRQWISHAMLLLNAKLQGHRCVGSPRVDGQPAPCPRRALLQFCTPRTRARTFARQACISS